MWPILLLAVTKKRNEEAMNHYEEEIARDRLLSGERIPREERQGVAAVNGRMSRTKRKVSQGKRGTVRGNSSILSEKSSSLPDHFHDRRNRWQQRSARPASRLTMTSGK